MDDTCMTCSFIGRKVWLGKINPDHGKLAAHQDTQASVTSQAVCVAGDKLVLLADVDKQGVPDLVKLLNRQVDSPCMLILHTQHIYGLHCKCGLLHATTQPDAMQVTSNVVGI